jgi:hypothetical protein
MSNRLNFGLFYDNVEKDREVIDYKDTPLEKDIIRPVVIEGLDILDTICPFNKFTGHRDNPLSLLGLITGANRQLLDSVLQDLPVISSDPNMSDEDRVNYLVPRLCSGTPAEQAIVVENMMKNIDALGLSSKKTEQIQSDQKIDFTETDVPSNPE